MVIFLVRHASSVRAASVSCSARVLGGACYACLDQVHLNWIVFVVLMHACEAAAVLTPCTY